MLYQNVNGKNRHDWIQKTLKSLPKGNLILDAGAGELPRDAKNTTGEKDVMAFYVLIQ